MELSLVDQFNQSDSIQVFDKVRIKNLIANRQFAKVELPTSSEVLLTFSTEKRNGKTISVK